MSDIAKALFIAAVPIALRAFVDSRGRFGPFAIVSDNDRCLREAAARDVKRSF